MGYLEQGVWKAGASWADADGQFRRQASSFRERVTQDGSSGFEAAAGRYHLYVSYACPWAHRTIIARSLRRLGQAVGLTAVDPHMGEDGWVFSAGPGAEPEPLYHLPFLRDLYVKARPDYSGRVTVPVLWDSVRETIVSNESREILRMLDTEFEHLAGGSPGLAPSELRGRVDAVIDALYEPVNNGVYRAGFATTQEAYEQACSGLFRALDGWDQVLGTQRYLCGATLTEADVCLFTTLLRFDLVYHGHFKCNLRRIQDYPNLGPYLRELYQMPAINQTCNLDHIKRHYYWSQPNVNPGRVVPLGPPTEYLRGPHDRGRFVR